MILSQIESINSNIPLKELLRKLARKSICRYKHAAVLLHKGNVIAVGYNRSIRKGLLSIHAEQTVLRKIPKGIDPRELVLVVVRVTATGFAGSKPCAACETMIKRSEIGLTIYS